MHAEQAAGGWRKPAPDTHEAWPTHDAAPGAAGTSAVAEAAGKAPVPPAWQVDRDSEDLPLAPAVEGTGNAGGES